MASQNKQETVTRHEKVDGVEPCEGQRAGLFSASHLSAGPRLGFLQLLSPSQGAVGAEPPVVVGVIDLSELGSVSNKLSARS